MMRNRIFVPTQVLTRSGSKGMISACKGTPQESGAKIIKICESKRKDGIIFEENGRE
jgi:hypothetical protein